MLVLVSPASVTIADVPPHNNYTLTCNATLPANYTLLNISLLWYDVPGGQQLNPNASIAILNITPYQIGDMLVYSSVLEITESLSGMVTRGCRAVVDVLRVVDGAVLSSRPVTNLVSTAMVTINGEN